MANEGDGISPSTAVEMTTSSTSNGGAGSQARERRARSNIGSENAAPNQLTNASRTSFLLSLFMNIIT